MKLRLTPQTLQILTAFLQHPLEWKYGYDISRSTGLKSGTLYPVLIRLAERKLLETEWEDGEPGRPHRHMYRLTSEGMQFAREHRLTEQSDLISQPALYETVFPWVLN